MNIEKIYKNIISLDCDIKNNLIQKNKRFLIEDEIYISELIKQQTPSFYEKMLIIKFLPALDKIISFKNIFNPNFMLCINKNTIEGIRDKYKMFHIITIEDIVNEIEDIETIREFIDIKRYFLTLFRMAYRHVHNDIETFEVYDSQVSGDAYLLFSTTNDITYFFEADLNRYNNINPIEKYSEEIVITTKIKLDKGISVGSPLQDEDKILIDKNMAEIELYIRFLCNLEYHLLIHSLVNKNDKINIYKRVGDWNQGNNVTTYENFFDEKCNTSIESIIERSIQDTNLGELLDIEKYIYPCWRIAYTHIKNDKSNYEILDNKFTKENPYLFIKLVLDTDINDTKE